MDFKTTVEVETTNRKSDDYSIYNTTRIGLVNLQRKRCTTKFLFIYLELNVRQHLSYHSNLAKLLVK